MLFLKVLIIDELIRGIDVGVKKEIYELFNELKFMGKVIIMILLDLLELFGIIDRIFVMNEGKILGEVFREEVI